MNGFEPVKDEPLNFTMVLFGANGDLAARKLYPSLYQLVLWGHLPGAYRIIGVGRRDLTHEEFRRQVREKILMFSSGAIDDMGHLEYFCSRFFHVRLDIERVEDYCSLQKEIMRVSGEPGLCSHLLFYLSTPPSLASVIVRHLREAGLGGKNMECGGWRKIVVEKPYGTDLRSAKELNAEIGSVFSEEQIFRIDHYLGKETVQNILVFRFSNGIFEPLWNRHHIARVDITIAENFGIRDRGAFYDQTGLLRDIVQNHGLQLLASIAMEPPVDLSADSVRDEKAKVLRSIRRVSPGSVERSVVLGQYEGYRAERQVAEDSMTETFAAVDFFVDNWRWKGVPFFIRAGKNLAETLTEIVITFACPPQNFFGPPESCSYTANQVILRIQPEETIAIRFGAKRPGESVITDPVYMRFNYRDSFTNPGMTPYHRLLLDAVEGNQMNFIRQDSVEYSWAVIDAIRDAVSGKMPEIYPAGSWGPARTVG
ncbi:MAG: glucose-6-phosphate dehydrogenase [Chlorobium sp.]|uniref:glucose-6-phosphate dehydrogenase n=1 Tax=Chlorobium sp. TaxID=1095 RepID=UPI002F427285